MSFSDTLSADGESASIRCTGTLYQLQVQGTFDGGTVTAEAKSYNGNWIVLGDTSLTADGAFNVEVPQGSEIRACLSGATSPSITTHFAKIK